ncbi:MAG: S8/S53 family peptidase [Acidobacteriota bacterium]
MRPRLLKRVISVFAIILIGGLGSPHLSGFAEQAQRKERQHLDPRSLAGGILLRFAQDPEPDSFGPFLDSDQEHVEVLQAREQKRRSEFEAEHGVQLEHITETPRGDIYKLDVDAANVERTMSELEQDPRVAQASPNWLVRGGPNPTTTPPEDWSEAQGFRPSSVSATGSDGTIVAGFFDGGLKQSDFEGDLWTGIGPDGNPANGFTILNGVQSNTPEEDPAYVHGDATAGILRLNFQRGNQMIGRDYQVQFLMIRMLRPDSFGSSADLVASAQLFLQYARTDATIRVLNMSLIEFGYNPFLEEALTEFFFLGGVWVASAGNGLNSQGRNLTLSPRYPGGYALRSPGAVVAATERNGTPTVWSDYYNRTTTWAVGVGVNSGLGLFLSGTSASAPQVAAGAALRKVMGESAATVLQAVAYSAHPRDDLAGRVIAGGGAYDLENLITGTTWLGQLKQPVTLQVNKAKPGKVTGQISDPALRVFVIGYPNLNVEVQPDGFFARKNPGFTHTPAWFAVPDGFAAAFAKVKGFN